MNEHTQNRMKQQQKNRKNPGPAPMFRQEESRQDNWTPPEKVEFVAGCICGAPSNRMRIYGNAKNEDGEVIRRYARCEKCGRKVCVLNSLNTTKTT